MKVISYSLYGINLKYWIGLLANLELAKVLMPDWTVRVYAESEVFNLVRHEMKTHASNSLWQIEVVPLRTPPMYARMLVADDPGVDRFIVRDLDSRLTMREALSVREWEHSGKPFAVWRDHPAHCMPIPGGMWGARGGTLPNMKTLIQANVKRLGRLFEYGDDQEFLANDIWPLVRNNTFNVGLKCGYEDVHPFPIKRDGQRFMGEVIEADGTPRKHDFDVIEPNS